MVLIQHDNLVALGLLPAHNRIITRYSGGDRHLLAKGDDLSLGLFLFQGLQQRYVLHAAFLCLDIAQQLLRVFGAILLRFVKVIDICAKIARMLSDMARVFETVINILAEAQQGLGDCG